MWKAVKGRKILMGWSDRKDRANDDDGDGNDGSDDGDGDGGSDDGDGVIKVMMVLE